MFLRPVTNLRWYLLLSAIFPIFLAAGLPSRAVANRKQLSTNDRALVVNGQEVDAETSFPWFVFNKFGQARGCGGTLIHKDIVLSTAMCYNVFNDRGAYVGGRSEYGFDGTFHEDETVAVHPLFIPETYANDLMLVKLETMSEATPVTLNVDPSVPVVGEEVLVIGFGDTRENGRLSPVLLQGTVNITDHDSCRDFYITQYETPISDAQICAMDQSPDATNDTRQDACHYDSGGPMLRRVDNTNTWEQVGITSFSVGCARENVPAVYVEISAYIDWIQAVVCELSSDPPSSCSKQGGTFTLTPTATMAPGSSSSSPNGGSNPSNPSASSGSATDGGVFVVDQADGSTMTPSTELGTAIPVIPAFQLHSSAFAFHTKWGRCLSTLLGGACVNVLILFW